MYGETAWEFDCHNTLPRSTRKIITSKAELQCCYFSCDIFCGNKLKSLGFRLSKMRWLWFMSGSWLFYQFRFGRSIATSRLWEAVPTLCCTSWPLHMKPQPQKDVDMKMKGIVHIKVVGDVKRESGKFYTIFISELRLVYQKVNSTSRTPLT